MSTAAPHFGIVFPELLWLAGGILSTAAFLIGVFLIIEGVFSFFRNKSEKATIFVMGNSQKLPVLCPEEGFISILTLQYYPEEGLTLLGAGTRSGVAGQAFNWGEEDNCIRFSVKNYAHDAAIDIRLKFLCNYRETEQPQPNVISTGASVGLVDYDVHIPVLKANGDEEYVFYVHNRSPWFASLSPKNHCIIAYLGHERDVKVTVAASSGQPSRPIFSLSPSKEI